MNGWLSKLQIGCKHSKQSLPYLTSLPWSYIKESLLWGSSGFLLQVLVCWVAPTNSSCGPFPLMCSRSIQGCGSAPFPTGTLDTSWYCCQSLLVFSWCLILNRFPPCFLELASLWPNPGSSVSPSSLQARRASPWTPVIPYFGLRPSCCSSAPHRLPACNLLRWPPPSPQFLLPWLYVAGVLYFPLKCHGTPKNPVRNEKSVPNLTTTHQKQNMPSFLLFQTVPPVNIQTL